MRAIAGTFVLDAVFALIVSILIAVDIVAAAGRMTNLNVPADTLSIEP